MKTLITFCSNQDEPFHRADATAGMNVPMMRGMEIDDKDTLALHPGHSKAPRPHKSCRRDSEIERYHESMRDQSTCIIM